ncbi:MAG TPA: MarR family transcriptional regulator, partial [Microthrixaceae bacterium]|nr:MarR family transcriptional regulator [Microthrixaceae bacterium]
SERQAWSNFLLTHDRVTSRVDAELSEACGITLAEYEVLLNLFQADRHQLRMSELADLARLSPSGLTRRFDILGNRGWVSRERCDDDRRGVVATLTKDGLKQVKAATPVHDQAWISFLFDTLGERGTKTLGSAMAKVAEANANSELEA